MTDFTKELEEHLGAPRSSLWYKRFHTLMPYRVREVLLVSSSYDAFILQEDGRLTERLFEAYSEMNLSSAPRVVHARNVTSAMVILGERPVDLVITMVRLEDTNVNEFGRMVKANHPDIPVVLLTFNAGELEDFRPNLDPKAIDRTFLWTGDTQILLSIIKLYEDEWNVDYDVRTGDVQVVVVVEDSPRYYSMFITLLYEELMIQSQSLIFEGLNRHHKLMRMRARPKLLLVSTYNEAVEVFDRFPENIIAIISDISFPMNGTYTVDAGIQLARYVQANYPRVEVLLQSALEENERKAEHLHIPFVRKTSSKLHKRIRRFLLENLGFGDFVFRHPDRTEVGRASNVYELLDAIKRVDDESLQYHAYHNHFSRWLMARSMFQLARRLQPRGVSEFATSQDLRIFILKSLEDALSDERVGAIADYDAHRTPSASQFVRIGSGSLGGKGRGIAFLNSMLARQKIKEYFTDLEVTIPKTLAVATDWFVRFVDKNQLRDFAEDTEDDEAILERFLEAPLPGELVEQLRFVLSQLPGPLAVRSSSLLEDSQYQPFAGIYRTVMLPNDSTKDSVRLRELQRAVKAVYASTYGESARTYLAGTSFGLEDEQMGIIIQQVVGNWHGDRFYPTMSGVGHTHNYYPVGAQKAEDGMALLALGLGQAVVQGESVLRFSPGTPRSLPQFTCSKDYLDFTQRRFYALTRQENVAYNNNADGAIELFELAEAEEDGVLQRVGSVYSVQDDAIRDNLRLPGPRIVTFNSVLKWNEVPLAETIRRVLRFVRSELGCAAEIEFAMNLVPGEDPVLYLLQVRPWATRNVSHDFLDLEEVENGTLVCQTNRSLGHGVLQEIQDIIYVKDLPLTSFDTPAVAEQVGQLNQLLKQRRRGYFLVGPGRWGSSDPRLGIPVKWSQISEARVVAELPFPGQFVEPSQGTHFFQNIISRGVGYLTLFDVQSTDNSALQFLDRKWLESLPIKDTTESVCHVRLPHPLTVVLDGRKGNARVFSPKEE